MKLKVRSVRRMSPVYKGTPRPAIVVAGRSNVGKSTLINTLLGKKVAATSKAPGRTRGVFRYLVNEQYDIIDLPGYGFARVSEELRRKWKRMVGDFLAGHDNIRCMLVLVDIRRGMGELDHELLSWCRETGVRAAVVLTKADKLSRSGQAGAVKQAGVDAGGDSEVFLTSATDGTGIRRLWETMAEWWSEDAFRRK